MMVDLRYEAPATLQAAVALLAGATGPARVLAGGTDVIVQMETDLIEPALLVDIKKIPEVGVGVNLTLDAGGTCTAARVALGAVAPTVLLVKEAADALIGSKLDEAALDKLAQAASAACRPIDDKRGTKEYRIKVAGVLAKRTAQQALERART